METLITAGGWVNPHSCLENCLALSGKVEGMYTLNPSNSIHTNATKYVQRCPYTWKQSKYLHQNKMWYQNKMECYTAMKKDELQLHTNMQMTL